LVAEPIQIALKVGGTLDALGIPWIVGGSVGAEDVILQKLRWYDAEQRVSERQWRDVLGVLKVRAGALDEGYLRQQAADAGLGELFQQALDDSRG
jgi:hypothetical protein